MDVTQMMTSGVAALVVIVGSLLKIGLNTLEKKLDTQDRKIEGKLDTLLCVERHETNVASCDKLFKHKHALTYADGRGGEVIIL